MSNPEDMNQQWSPETPESGMAPPPPPPPPPMGQMPPAGMQDPYAQQQPYGQQGYGQPNYGQQQSYGQPGYQGYPTAPVVQAYTPDNAVPMLVVSILSLVVCPFLAIWSFVQSKRARKEAADLGLKTDGMTTASFVISIVGMAYAAFTAVAIVLWVTFMIIALAVGDVSSSFTSY
jgi:hypothetical protein